MRHAKSDWTSGADTDFERPLARRAEVTARLVLTELNYPENNMVWDDRIYDGDLTDLLDIIRDHQSIKSLMLIGHNPGLEFLLHYLSITRPDSNQGGKILPTAAIALLAFAGKKIVAAPDSAKIKVIQRPRELS
jgi:phosphohistidine phosphatase